MAKKVLVAWVGICGWIDSYIYIYTTRLPGQRAHLEEAEAAGKGCGKEGASCLGWNLWLD